MSLQVTGYDSYYYLAKCLEGVLFGIYSGLFAIHLAYHATKRETDCSRPDIIFYALWVLYVLTGAVCAIEILPIFDDIALLYRFNVALGTIFGSCDFIAQCILIHRCWIVWGQNTRVIIVPSILALAYLVMWTVAAIGSTFTGLFFGQSHLDQTVWGNKVVFTSLIVSMTVNALVTGLIVFRIFRVFREVKSVNTMEDKSSSGNKLRSVTFIIIESGMALFAVQLARVALTINLRTLTTGSQYSAFQIIIAIHEIVNGIAPTIILVRVSLGLSFHDEESLVEAVSSLQFAADDPNPITEAGGLDQDRSSHIGHDDDLNPLRDDEIGGSDDIQIELVESEDSQLPMGQYCVD